MLDTIKLAILTILTILTWFVIPFLLGWLLNTAMLNLLQFCINNIIQADYRYNVWVGGLILQTLSTFVFNKKNTL